LRWLIVAGGTGGHLFPGIAVGEELLKLGREVYFVSGTRKVERVILKNKPFKVYELEVEGFLGRSIVNKTRAFVKMIRAFLKAYKLIKKLNPEIIFATGGYISFPVVAAAKLQGKVTGLHEQNIEPGLANRVLSKLVDKVFISIKGSEKYFPERKIIFSGNPIRKELLNKKPREHSGKGLLILGGSLGARFINDLALKVVPELLKSFSDLFIIHQTGLEDFERVKREYTKMLDPAQKDRIRVYAFIEDMNWAYSQVDLVLGRAGATTLAELFAVGIPAIFIPFPYATNNHQEKNASIVAEKGGAILIRQSEATRDKVLSELSKLLNSPEKLKSMSKAMQGFFIKDSEKIIINELERLVKNA